MLKEELEHSDDETSYGSNSVGSRGGISSVTGGFPVYSSKNNDEEDLMEKVSVLMKQKLKSAAAHPSPASPKPKLPQQRTGGANSLNAKQE